LAFVLVAAGHAGRGDRSDRCRAPIVSAALFMRLPRHAYQSTRAEFIDSKQAGYSNDAAKRFDLTSGLQAIPGVRSASVCNHEKTSPC